MAPSADEAAAGLLRGDCIEKTQDAGAMSRLGRPVPRYMEPEIVSSADPYERCDHDDEALQRSAVGRGRDRTCAPRSTRRGQRDEPWLPSTLAAAGLATSGLQARYG